MMNYDDTNEAEIDLLDMFFYILRKWRPIIMVAIIVGLLLGGYKLTKVWSLHGNIEATQEIKSDYEKDQIAYERTLATYEREIVNNQNMIENQDIYLQNSILMKISPYEKPIASVVILVKLDESEWNGILDTANIDPTDSLIKAYASNIIQGTDWKKIVADTGVEAVYLKELVSVRTDYDSNTLSIDVTYLDEETANEILDEILNQVELRHNDMQDSVAVHTIAEINRTSGLISDLNLADIQNANNNKYASYQKNLTEKEKALEELTEPSRPVALSKRQLIKTVIKYAVLGGVLGGFIMVCYFSALYLMSAKLHTQNELKEKFGFKILGIFALPSKKRAFSVVDRWIERFDRNANVPCEEAIIKRAALNIQMYAEGNKKILVTGSIVPEKIEEITNKLSEYMKDIELKAGPSINNNINTLHLLTDNDAVVLIEQRFVSRNDEIQKEWEIIESLKKPVIGCLIL